MADELTAGDISQISISDGKYDIKDNYAIANITRNGTTFTVTRRNGTTFTFTQQDNNTTYAAASSVTDVATSSVVGTSTAYARQDHQHAITKATITSALGYTPIDAANISGAMHFAGTTTASITDGSTTKPSDITGSGTSGALASGDVIISGEKEFV